jgi:endo-1,4-beta-xylanase
MARYEAAGLDVWITEMDVRVPVDESGDATAADLERQATMFHDLIRTCVDAPNCDRVTLWGFTDARSWITENAASFPGAGAAHPYDEAYLPKPAYEAILDAVSSPPAPSGSKP